MEKEHFMSMGSPHEPFILTILFLVDGFDPVPRRYRHVTLSEYVSVSGDFLRPVVFSSSVIQESLCSAEYRQNKYAMTRFRNVVETGAESFREHASDPLICYRALIQLQHLVTGDLTI
jgi:hypothetical protein